MPGPDLRPAGVEDRGVLDRHQRSSDLLTPYVKGWEDRPVRWCRCRQDRPIREMIYRVAENFSGVSVFAGVGERTREATTSSWR